MRHCPLPCSTTIHLVSACYLMACVLTLDRDGDHITLLHIAAEEGNLEGIRLLLGAEADVDACDKNGWTPLHCASYQGHEEAVTLLLSASADCTMTTNDHNTALHYFVRSCDPVRVPL